MIMGLSAATAAVAATGAVSSFAWFATNATAGATGMKVKVQSASTLLIDLADATTKTYATESNGRLKTGSNAKAATNSDPADGLKPTSTVNGTDWFYAEGATVSDEAAKANTYAKVKDTDLDKYRLANTFYLQDFDATKKTGSAYDASTKKLVVDYIDIAYPTTDKLNSGFRVLVVIGDSKVFCAPTLSDEPKNSGVSSVDENNSATMGAITFADGTLNANKATFSSNNTLVDTVNYNQVYTCNVYLYFDGEDTNCYTDNIPATLADYTVSVYFSLQDKQ